MKEYIKHWAKLIKESIEFETNEIEDFVKELYPDDEERQDEVLYVVYNKINELINGFFEESNDPRFEVCSVIDTVKNEVFQFNRYVDEGTFERIYNKIQNDIGINLIVDEDEAWYVDDNNIEYDEDGLSYSDPKVTPVFVEIDDKDKFKRFIDELV